MSVSLYGNLFFVVVELFMAVCTGSQAVLLDAVYDGIEFFMLLPSIFLIPLLYRPASEDHPYGYMQLETIFLVIKGSTMTAVTIGLIINNIQFLIHGGRSVSFQTVAYFELFACLLGLAVYFLLNRKNRALNSPLIEVEMNGWKIDSVISLGMTVAFFLPHWIPFDWFKPVVPYLDPLITVVLSMIMLPVPIKTVITAFRDLMLIPPEEEIIQDIKSTVDPFLDACGCVDYSYDILRTGRKLWISAYVIFEKDKISLSKLRDLEIQCRDALKSDYADIFFELIPEFQEAEPAAPVIQPS